MDILEEDGYYINPKELSTINQALLNEDGLVKIGDFIHLFSQNRQVIFPKSMLNKQNFSPTEITKTDEDKQIFVFYKPTPFFRESLNCTDYDSDNNKRIRCFLLNEPRFAIPFPGINYTTLRVYMEAGMNYEKKKLFGWGSTSGFLFMSGNTETIVSCSGMIPPTQTGSIYIFESSSNASFLFQSGETGGTQADYPVVCTTFEFTNNTSVEFDRRETPVNTNDLTCVIEK